jgi:glycosyltransferase involved in cell wall biosynthesis
MEDQHLVSVVTPSYNQVRFLERTILSVLEQEYQAVQYIIVDGGSTDGSLEVIDKYQDDIDQVVIGKDQGQTDAINIGIDLAKGTILSWLNSDDTYYPWTLSEVVQAFRDYPTAGMIYGDADIIDAQGKQIGTFNAQQTNFQRLMRGGVYIPQPAAFWKKKYWDEVGPLDPSFYFAMDYDLWIRLAKRTKLLYLPKLWASFRVYGETKSVAEDNLCWPEMRRIYRREGGRFVSIFTLKFYLRKVLGRFWNWLKIRKLDI